MSAEDKRPKILFGIGLLATVLISSPTMANDKFDHLIREAIEKGPSIKSADQGRQASEDEVKRAWSRFLPSVSANGGIGVYDSNSSSHSSRNYSNDGNYDYSIEARMPIFHGGRNYYGLKEAKARASGENHNFDHVRQQFALDVVRVLLTVRRERAIYAKRKKNVSNVSKLTNSTYRRYNLGEGTKTDISIAKDQLKAARDQLEQTHNNLQRANEEYARLFGRKPGKISSPDHIFKRLPKSLKRATQLALRNNPEILTNLYQTDAARSSLRATYGNMLPQLDLVGSYSGSDFYDYTDEKSRDTRVMLRASVPLLNFENYANNDIAEHRHLQAAYQADDTIDRVKAMARISWDAHKSALNRDKIALGRVQEAKKALYGVRREYDAGQRSLLDVLDIEERLIEASIVREMQVYEKYMSAYLLLATTGDLHRYLSGRGIMVSDQSSYEIRSRYQSPFGTIGNWRTRIIPEAVHKTGAIAKTKVTKTTSSNWLTNMFSSLVSPRPSIHLKPSTVGSTGTLSKKSLKKRKTSGLKTKPKKKLKYSKKVRSKFKTKVLKAKSKKKKQLNNQQVNGYPMAVMGSVTRKIVPSKKKVIKKEKIRFPSLSNYYKKVTMTKIQRFKMAENIPTPTFKSRADKPILTGSIRRAKSNNFRLKKKAYLPKQIALPAPPQKKLVKRAAAAKKHKKQVKQFMKPALKQKVRPVKIVRSQSIKKSTSKDLNYHRRAFLNGFSGITRKLTGQD